LRKLLAAEGEAIIKEFLRISPPCAPGAPVTASTWIPSMSTRAFVGGSDLPGRQLFMLAQAVASPELEEEAACETNQ
jgi:hypothetical protein